MSVGNVALSYHKTEYVAGERQNSNQEPVFKTTAKNSQDRYTPSVNETYYTTYTSGGVMTGEEVSPQGKEENCVLPERYNGWKSCYMYYQGNRISEYELIQTAVKTGAITLDESKPVGWNLSNAEEALLYSKATPLYEWSTTLYSEDRRYVYRVENGQITGATAAYFRDGTTYLDVLNAIAGGTELSNIELYKLEAVFWHDSEAYDAAVNIGTAKRRYDTLTDMYQNGQLTQKQFRHDCYPLWLLLFGKDADIHNDEQFGKLSDFFGQDREKFLKKAFANYNSFNQSLVDKLLIEKGYHAYSGLY